MRVSVRQQAVLAAAQEARGVLSDAELADECGVAPQTVLRLCSGRPLKGSLLGRLEAGLHNLHAASAVIDLERRKQSKPHLETKTHQPKKEAATMNRKQRRAHKLTLETVSIDLLDPLPEQPDSRLTDSVLATTLDDVRRNGIIRPLAVVRIGNRYLIADGHGRWTIGKQLGYTELLCEVYVADKGKEHELARFLFEKLNGLTNKKMAGFGWLEFFYKSGGRDSDIPGSALGHIRQCMKHLGGMDGVAFLIAHRTPPVLIVRAVAANCRFQMLSSTDGLPTIKTIMRWAIINHSGKILAAFFGTHRVATTTECKRILAAIKADRPISVRQAEGLSPVRLVKSKAA